jgi:hypothetical protein
MYVIGRTFEKLPEGQPLCIQLRRDVTQFGAYKDRRNFMNYKEPALGFPCGYYKDFMLGRALSRQGCQSTG